MVTTKQLEIVCNYAAHHHQDDNSPEELPQHMHMSSQTSHRGYKVRVGQYSNIGHDQVTIAH